MTSKYVFRGTDRLSCGSGRAFAGSAWLVTFPEGHNYDSFEIDMSQMGGRSPFSRVEEVSEPK